MRIFVYLSPERSLKHKKFGAAAGEDARYGGIEGIV
jgi:hypothetical protein